MPNECSRRRYIGDISVDTKIPVISAAPIYWRYIGSDILVLIYWQVLNRCSVVDGYGWQCAAKNTLKTDVTPWCWYSGWVVSGGYRAFYGANNHDLSLPSGSDILRYLYFCRTSGISCLPINLQYISYQIWAIAINKLQPQLIDD